ncbi:MAG: LPPG:FO 2-phospho-L-lactate transferase [Bermanella sp.]|jgi:LPPG:FO 2-phospho-L-lactate transferase
MSKPSITLLAGGVGGAKAAEGLAASRYADSTAIIGNIADDEEFHGLWVSPDIDTLIYSLGNQIDRKQGWGRVNESHQVLNELKALGEDTWMALGDLDLATHILRTKLRYEGVRPSLITQRIAQRHCVSTPILLPTDDVVQTHVKTNMGWLSFQEFFVREQCHPDVFDIQFKGAKNAQACPEAIQQILQSDVVVIAPSNPIVSIGAILSIPGIQQAIEHSQAYVIAISPLINGRAIKGPADKLLKSAGFSVDSMGVYRCYADFLDAMVIDSSDEADALPLKNSGLDVLVTQTLMQSNKDKQSLLEQTIDYALSCQKLRAA